MALSVLEYLLLLVYSAAVKSCSTLAARRDWNVHCCDDCTKKPRVAFGTTGSSKKQKGSFSVPLKVAKCPAFCTFSIYFWRGITLCWQVHVTLHNNQPLIASEMHKMSILSEHSTVNISDCSYMFIDQCKISRWEAPHQKYTRNTFYIVAAKGRKCSFFVQPAAKKKKIFHATHHTPGFSSCHSTQTIFILDWQLAQWQPAYIRWQWQDLT